MTPNSGRDPAVRQRIAAAQRAHESAGYATGLTSAPVPLCPKNGPDDQRRWFLVGFYAGRDARPGRPKRIAERRGAIARVRHEWVGRGVEP